MQERQLAVNNRLNEIRLTLFFTRGMSLKAWDQIGMFDREVALYKRLQDNGVAVNFVTYGSADDLQYGDRIKGINILCNRWNLPRKLYEHLLPWLHSRELGKCSVIKTNQIDGADIALRAANRFGKPLIARCGYMWSYNTAKRYGYDSRAAKRARNIEADVFSAAKRVIVTTKKMAEDIEGRVSVAASRTSIIPNYVDTTLFRPSANENKDYDIVFVGRLSPEKNVETLLEAVKNLKLKILLIGDGPLKNVVKKYLLLMNGNLVWHQRVSHSDLPCYLNRSRSFILPSYYEGHPKTLIEAMSCGLPVIGADSPGIREILKHNENGLLCGSDVQSIRETIQTVRGKKCLSEHLGRNARKYVEAECSLNHIIKVETEVLCEAAFEKCL